VNRVFLFTVISGAHYQRFIRFGWALIVSFDG
jgi:hypothetical protein